jgi:transglutaminase-like putative cysteine protease
MLIRIAFDIAVSAPAPTPVILALSPRPEEMSRISAGPLRIDSAPAQAAVEPRWFRDVFGNTRARFVMPAGRHRLTWEGYATDSGRADDVHPDAIQHPVQDLPDGVLQYLQPSRYCESDLLSQEAWDRFGAIPTGWGKVQAICDFAHDHLKFDYKDASPFRTAAISLQQGKAVCRDFAHLVIAFSRALNIPARYASGYLGDIEWPDMGPGDFCAWTEIFLGGRWYTFDARYNVPRIGRIVMVRGRDAGDVPMMTSFGPTQLESFQVFCDEVKPQLAAAE